MRTQKNDLFGVKYGVKTGAAMAIVVLLFSACTSASGGRKKSDASSGDGSAAGFATEGTTDGTAATSADGGSGGETGSDTGTTGGGTSTGGSGSTGGPAGLPCGADADCPVYLPFCSAAGICVECHTDVECDQKFCFEGKCLACQNGNKICSSNKVVQCNEQGTGFEVVEECPADGTCNAGQCFNCYPSTKKCEEAMAYECAPTGEEWVLQQDCAASGLQCNLGVCLSACGLDFKANTNAGCGFFAVDLDNAVDFNGIETLDAANAQFAVVVSNTSAISSSEVTVTQPDGTKETKSVAPRSIQTFLLPSSFSLEEAGISNSAFRIDATSPITVYQFNPLSNEGVFSNDASVLLPANGLGNEYYAMSHRQIETSFHGFVTVVGISDVATSVTVTPSAPTKAAADQSLPAIAQWESYTFSITQGQVVNIRSNAPSADLTGTHVLGDGPIAVFSGHEAAVTSDQCCADHLEQQMVPVSAWGTKYVMTRSMERGLEKDYFRIVASQDQTTVQFNPAVTSPPVQVLQAGGFIEFSADASFTVTADKPVMAAQLLASSFEVVNGSGGGGFCFADTDCPGGGYMCLFGQCNPPACGSDAQCPTGHICNVGTCSPIGDPALILAVPVEQWREEYVFLTPNSYAKDYINIISDGAATVSLDDNPIPASAWTAISGSQYRVYRTLVEDGVHTIASDLPVSVIVYGYDKDVSYGYPGGLGLSAL